VTKGISEMNQQEPVGRTGAKGDGLAALAILVLTVVLIAVALTQIL
jgi:hypothetical protein